MKGHLEARGKNTWSIVLELGRDADGARTRRRHTYHGPKRAAEQEMTRLLREIDTGTYIEPERLTVAQYLERWLKDSVEPNVAPRTAERYATIVRKHLVPALGHHPLTKLFPLHVSDYYSEALKTGRVDDTGGLSAQTVLHHHRVLREALQQAVKWQLVLRNVADAVDPPRPERKEMQSLDEKQTAALLQKARGTRMYLPILLAVTTGLRRGELLALRWSDVDLDSAKLAVCRSLQATKTQGLIFREPKTQRSRRVVSLMPITVDALKKHKREQDTRRMQFRKSYADGDLVFAGITGQVWHPSSFTGAWHRFTEKNDVSIRFHDLRHSHATQLLRQGIHPKIVSERLGHSTIGITLDTYSHVLPDMQEEAAIRMDGALRAAITKARRRAPKVVS